MGEDFSASANVNNCDEANTLSSFLPDYFSAVDDYLSFVSDVPDKCTDAQDALHRYGVEHKNKTIWVFYGMFLVCLAVYTVGMCMSNKIVIYSGFCITDIVMFITFILCGVVMIMLVSSCGFMRAVVFVLSTCSYPEKVVTFFLYTSTLPLSFTSYMYVHYHALSNTRYINRCCWATSAWILWRTC